jgi:hypothetical protein
MVCLFERRSDLFRPLPLTGGHLAPSVAADHIGTAGRFAMTPANPKANL